MKGTKVKSSKGITLVALVITIIILLILAVVAINAVNGNGIIAKAKETKENYKNSITQEKKNLLLEEWKIASIDENFDVIAFLNEKKENGSITRYIDMDCDTYLIIIENEEFKLSKNVLNVTDEGILNNGDIKWALYDNGLLEITGTGTTKARPWGERHNLEVKNVYVGEGITGVPNLHSCINLENVILPTSIEIVQGGYLFYKCSNFKINISDLDKYLKIQDENGQITFYSASNWSLILNGEPVTEVVYPEGIVSTGSLLTSCSTIRKVTLPESIRNVGKFTGCTSLESINIPEGVTTLNSAVFHECSKLKTIEFPSTIETLPSQVFGYCSSLEKVTFKGKPTSISDTLFKWHSFKTVINVPWKEGEVEGAPWGASKAIINYGE